MEATPKLTQTVKGWAAMEAKGKITPFIFQIRENGEDDVSVKILYCGMCDVDLISISNKVDTSTYPLVPGHEIAGVITKVGSNVSNFKVGDRVGVWALTGCNSCSCLNCEFCKDSQENYCSQIKFVNIDFFGDKSTTYGGYSEMIVTNKRYLIRIPDNLPLDSVAPMLCAGVTVYTPMKDHNILKAGKKLGVVGLGGLGHVAVKFGKAFGMHVTVISTSPSKEKEAKLNLGVDNFIISNDPKQMQDWMRTLDYIIDTVPAKHSLGPILDLLKVRGKLILLGSPDEPLEVPVGSLISGIRSVSGNLYGGMKEAQEMMDVCGKLNITCDIELIKPNYINEALERIGKNDVRYRFVIDIAGESNL